MLGCFLARNVTGNVKSTLPDKVFVINIDSMVIGGFPPRSVTQVDSMETAEMVARESGLKLKVYKGASPLLSLNEKDEQYVKFE